MGVLGKPLCVSDDPSLDFGPFCDADDVSVDDDDVGDDDAVDDDDEDDAVQSLLSGSTNLCDECGVSRSRQPICLPPSPPPSLLVSTGCPLFQLVSIGYPCFSWFLLVLFDFINRNQLEHRVKPIINLFLLVIPFVLIGFNWLVSIL